jgi:prolyl 4-hydroxylase
MSKQGPDGPSKARAATGREVAARLDAGARRVPAANAQIYRRDDFLSAEECAALVALVDQDLRPSEVFAKGDWVTEFRSSRTCDFDIWQPTVAPIDARICALLGLSGEHGEPPQGQRYDPGQQFRAHCDWFEGDQPYWPGQVKCGGQRTWTAMIYLNKVEEGGATWFPQAGVRFVPRPGMLIAWNNMRPDGSPNPDTIHEGMRVVAGSKYVLTKWFREGVWAYPSTD